MYDMDLWAKNGVVLETFSCHTQEGSSVACTLTIILYITYNAHVNVLPMCMSSTHTKLYGLCRSTSIILSSRESK